MYGIVRQSNGFIEVSSAQGQGTTFRIYLPQLSAEKGLGGCAAEQDRSLRSRQDGGIRCRRTTR